MTTQQRFKCFGVGLLLTSLTANVQGGLTDLSSTPLVVSSTASSTLPVRPNILFVLDDSGSMDWDYLPDWANDNSPPDYLFRNSSFNGVYYNPAVTYSPPAAYNANGTVNTTLYPSQTSANTSGWTAVKRDGYGKQSTATDNLVNNAYFYTIVPGEYCTNASLKTCATASAPSSTYPTPAYLRWCNGAGTTCQATWISGSYTNWRAPAPRTSSFTVSGTSNTSVSSIKVNGLEILSGTTTASSTSSTVASNIATKINACTKSQTGNCTTVGYSASVSGSTVTIYAPGAISYTPVITKSGSMTMTPTAFAQGNVPGENLFTTITSTVTSYPYPGTTTKASTRTDCAGTTCTYAEEMTNYANWWAYYHTRMQMMKTAASIAFSSLNSNYRVGYMSINNNTGSDFLNLDTFDSTHKYDWYTKFFNAKPNNSTPLRVALATAGRLYAGKLSSVNSVAATDPVQYSCQQNFTILSTDGYWNETTTPTQIDGSTAIGNQDGSVQRPQYDGATSSTVYKATITVNSASNTSVTSITVNGKEILSGPTAANSTASTVATRIATNINNCTSAATGNCQISGYSASRSGSTVTVTAPAAVGAPSTPVVNTSGGGSVTASAFSGTGVATGGSSNSLADVAQYYYTTDLRTWALGNCTGSPVPPATTGNTLCVDPSTTGGTDTYNNVPTSGDDSASWQHMTTFTLGLGASGYMQFLNNYASLGYGDYLAVKNGSKADAASGVCTWQTDGTACNWPTPASNSQTNIDDLWHAAVNGRGTYFSATKADELATGLSNALAGIKASTGASAAATTSNPNVTSGDNFVFSSTFVTQKWTGELVRQQLDLSTGQTLPAIDWAAQTLLDAKTTRTIYTYDSTNANSNYLKPFDWSSLTTTERAYFSTPYITTLSQFCASGSTCLTSAQQSSASGQNLVNYLRGDRTYENVYYRQRDHVLGDIVNAEAVYVKGSLFNYSDYGYSAFASSNATRRGMVYAAGNDGMLHAFYADTDSANGITGGDEAWAYVPSAMLPTLFNLADNNYANLHRYFVDGTPVVSDICVSNCSTASAVWKTILVGGYNNGGKGYYALDITNPASPKALWEFTDTNMGYSFGNPEITKLKNGTWVVLVSSGYNNIGDGVGRLYVINAATGALIRSISTGVGNAATPSGLSRIVAQVVNSASDNTAIAVYGGDTLGNLWRFDVNGDIGAAGYDAHLLATLRNASGIAQPITAKPQVGLVSGNVVVYAGTGRYLGNSDLTDMTQQSIYAIKDVQVPDPTGTGVSGSPSYGDPRAYGGFIQQTLTKTTCPSGTPSTICSTGQTVLTSTNHVVNFATDNGWYVDLIESGERANNDPTLKLGTLGFTTNVPTTSACTVGGYSYTYFFDYRTGGPVSTSTTGVVGTKLGNALATRPVYVRLPNNTVVQLIRLSDGTTMTTNVPIGAGSVPTRRVSWRELIME